MSEIPAPRFVVYRDRNYHRSWIYREATEQIADYLTSLDPREKRFIEMDAPSLLHWMETVTRTQNQPPVKADETVVVFSQDMIPDILALDPTPETLIRRYLERGGRVVWIGDIPFWRQGKRYVGVEMTSRDQFTFLAQRGEIYENWPYFGPFSILGINVEFNYSPTTRVEITDDGQKWGLGTHWYGTRPIQKGGKDITVLAQSSAFRARTPELLNMEAGKPETTFEGVVSAMSDYVDLITLAISLIAGIGAYSWLRQWLSTTSSASGIWLTAVIVAIVVSYPLLRALRVLHKKIRPKKYANAWVKNFNSAYPHSGFVRIWDHHVYSLSRSELEELRNVALHNLP